jgi:mannose-6-phosphate isomerase-like protein (cupin superfamily)
MNTRQFMRLSSTGCFPNCVRQRNGNTSTEKSIFVLRKHRSNPPMNTDPQQRRVAPPFRAGYRQRRTLGYSCSVITSQAKLIFGVDMEMESRIFSVTEYIRPSDGEPIRSVVLETKDSAVVVWHAHPGQEITAHVHPDGQDTWTVISGEAEYYQGGGKVAHLKAGDIARSQAVSSRSRPPRVHYQLTNCNRRQQRATLHCQPGRAKSHQTVIHIKTPPSPPR